MEDAAGRIDALERVLADLILKQGLMNRQFGLLMNEIKQLEEELRTISIPMSHS
ncbi:hypothetical protein [Heyndrickxia acidiproducens]|uniref:hypothetical protein n=1 Tax=Heyndrickxia acidiproducens TaxID=1121084 RepID=UPI000377E518|nr:hypothetical protein [Heyndrickxia acidiproducens]